MEKPKRCKLEDRLSELPDSLIFDIFWLLPMTDVVRTSLLSKRWRNLWTTTPFLNFDNRAMLFDDSRLGKFVNRALLCWNGNRVLKFRFHSRNELVNSMFRDIDLWMNFAKRNGVQELHLHVMCITTSLGDGDYKEKVYCVPQGLYSCSSLKELTLEHCIMEISRNAQWNQLKSLTIKGVRATADLINQILSSTPQLRVFILRYADRGGNLSIQSSSLKELSIWKYVVSREDVPVVSELRICTPNLETLEIRGVAYSKCWLTNVSSLTRTTLALFGPDHCGWDGLRLLRVGFGHHLSSEKALSQIFPTIQHVENVTLSCCCTKVLRVMKMKCKHSSFPKLKTLELNCCFFDYEQVASVLEMFPHLERLVIWEQKGDDHQDDQESIKFVANLPESFLLQLRTIEVNWSEGYGVFPLIEILFKYASKLEKIVFHVKEIKPPPSDSLYLVSQKLLRMRRSSTNCSILVGTPHDSR